MKSAFDIYVNKLNSVNQICQLGEGWKRKWRVTNLGFYFHHGSGAWLSMRNIKPLAVHSRGVWWGIKWMDFLGYLYSTTFRSLFGEKIGWKYIKWVKGGHLLRTELLVCGEEVQRQTVSSCHLIPYLSPHTASFWHPSHPNHFPSSFQIYPVMDSLRSTTTTLIQISTLTLKPLNTVHVRIGNMPL